MEIHSDLQGEELLETWAAWRAEGKGLDDLAGALGITYGSLRGRIKRARLAGGPSLEGAVGRPAGGEQLTTEGDENLLEITSPKGARITTLDGLLAAAEVDTKTWEVERYLVNKWEVGAVVDGAVVATPLFQVKAWLRRKIPLEAFPTLQPVEVRALPAPWPELPGGARARPSPGAGLGYALIIPDLQCGFRRDPRSGKLTPFHDRRAMDVVLQVAQTHEFDTIVLLGDLLDLAEWSDRFIRSPDMYVTTQPAIIELAWWLARLRDAQPRARILALEGNHDERLPRAINSHLAGAFQLRPATEALMPPALSVPRLLGLPGLQIEWVDGYPNNKVWLNSVLVCEHGERARSGPGDTAKSMVAEAVVSRIFGHIHREEVAIRTLVEHGRSRTIRAVSPGCLCRIDGAVPGHTLSQNWSQGFAVAHYAPEGWHAVDVIPIIDGCAVYGMDVYTGRDLVADLRRDTGWDTF